MQADVLVPQDDVLCTTAAHHEVFGGLARPLHLQAAAPREEERPLLCQVSLALLAKRSWDRFPGQVES